MSLENVVANLVQKVERRFYGKYRGFVVDNADPEKLGRLKVRVPSVLGDQVVTGWAMPCVPYGGDADQGFLFIPEVGAGVWVEFEEGDLEFPIWAGTFWSKPGGDSELPKTNGEVQDPPTQKIIKTKKGHTIQLEDKDDEEKVVVSHKGGGKIEIDKNGSVLIANEKSSFLFLNAEDEETTMLDGHQNLITMKEDGLVVASKGCFIEMKEGKMKVTSDDAVQVSAKEVVLNASSISLGGSQAAFSVLVGELFATIFDTHVHPHPMGPTLPPAVPLSASLQAVSSKSVKII